jgi:hypothetical protein
LFQLGAEHVYGSVVVKIPAKRNVKPISLLAFNGELVGLIDVCGVRGIASGLCDDVDK